MCPRPITPTYFDRLMSACSTHGFSPRVLHEARSVSSQIALVGCGQGIALVPKEVASSAGERVVVRPLAERIEIVTMALAWNTERLGPAAEKFVALASSPRAQSPSRV